MLALIAVILVAFSNLALGIIVLLKNRGDFTHTSFGIFAFILSAWILTSYFSNSVSLNYQLVIWLNRATIFLPGLGLYFLLLFSLEFTKYRYEYFRPFAIFFGLSTLAISLVSTTPLLVARIVPKEGIETIRFGVLAPFFSLFIVTLFLANILILAGSIRHLKGAARARTKIMTVSLFAALAITVITNLILPVAFNNYSYILVGLLSTIIIVGGFAFAIVRHRLFDIRTIVARSIVYILLLGTLSSLYAFITFRIGGILFSHSKLSAPQQTFNIVTALILALTFQPLQHLFEIITDKFFFRGRYKPEKIINQIGQVLAAEIDLVQQSRRVRNLLAKHLRVKDVNIVVLNNNKVFAEAGQYVVSRLEGLAKDLNRINGRIIVTDEEPEGARKEILQKYGISIFVSLRTQEGKIGYLLFGQKLSGDIFSNTDIDVIDIIADQLAVAIQNAKAYVQIQQFNQTLRTKVTDATKQLREANASLQELDKVKDDFISMVSHQLRTPLTVIDGYISNVMDDEYGALNKRQEEALNIARNRLQITKSLVSDMLNISRMETGRFYMEMGPTNFNTLIPEEIEQLEIKAGENKVKLTFHPPKKPVPIISADEQKTRQAIMNLIDNAITYTPAGTVDVYLESSEQSIIFRVVDNGIGVPADQQSHLFTKFYRANNARKERPDGTGIGLYLVKRVIEEQGGSIIFITEEGKGSTFGFRYPLGVDTPYPLGHLLDQKELAATGSRD